MIRKSLARIWILAAALAVLPAFAQSQNKAPATTQGTQQSVPGLSTNAEANKLYASGAHYLEVGVYPTAMSTFKKALELDPNFTAALEGEGVAFFGMGAYSMSRDAFVKYNARSQGSLNSFLLLGRADVQMMNYAEAVPALQKALAMKPDAEKQYAANYDLGRSYYYLHQMDRCVASFQEALRLKPTDVAALSALGTVYAEQGRKNDAMEMYRRLVPVDKKVADGLLATINKAAQPAR